MSLTLDRDDTILGQMTLNLEVSLKQLNTFIELSLNIYIYI